MSFIFTDQEYEDAKKMLANSDKQLAPSSRTSFSKAKDDIAIYEQLKAGQLAESYALDKLGRMLTCLRIASGLSQEELAARLSEEPRVVQKNERNEYHGVSVIYAQRVIDALGAKVNVRATLL